MGRLAIPVEDAGSEFVLEQNQLHLGAPIVASEVALEQVASAIMPALTQPHDFSPPAGSDPTSIPPPAHFLATLQRHSLLVFAVLFLLVAGAGTVVGGRYWSAHVINAARPIAAVQPVAPTIAGLNVTVPAKDIQTRLQAIENQPATLTVGTKTIPVGADTIRSWLQIDASKDKSQDYIHIKSGTIAASLNKLAGQFVKDPVSQVVVSEDGVSRVITAGRNGTALSDPTTLKTQADQVAKTVMDSKGLQFTTPLQTSTFSSVTPVAFSKLLVVNVSTKKMWAFQNGQQVNTWLVSAGKPSTPTPLGQFHIYAKYTVQDMRGFNPDGTPYFQPHVHWVNYFSGGSAIHGVYWHPLSWFGVNNSSHGCVGIPDTEAAWIYNWAPIGTTVITHA